MHLNKLLTWIRKMKNSTTLMEEEEREDGENFEDRELEHNLAIAQGEGGQTKTCHQKPHPSHTR